MTTLVLASGMHVDGWVMLTAVLVCSACAIIGTFLVLRGISLLGDAISHAILPGIAIAFLMSGTRDVLPMMTGAIIAAVVTAGLSTGVQRLGRLGSDASLGVVFSTLFAIGVLLITWSADRVDLDPGCVLYGQIEFVPLDTTHIAGMEIPRAVLWLGVTLIVDGLFLVLLFKELRIASFDPILATSMGLHAGLIHAILLAMVATTSVAAFESVGSILVVAMLVAPGATAHLLTDRLSRTLWLAGALGASAGALGVVVATWIDTSVAGVISVMSGIQFGLAVMLSPRHGLMMRRVRRLKLTLRIEREDQLAVLYRWQEAGVPDAPPPMASSITQRLARWLLALDGSMRVKGGKPSLTPRGLEQGAAVVRAHRLWETYLAQKTPLPLDHLHEASHRVEHFVSSELAERLSRVVNASEDPHGRPIPPAEPPTGA